MPARSILAAGASAARKYRWRAIAGAAAVLIVCVGLALAMLEGDSSPDSKGSSLADGARFVFVPNRSTAEVAVIDGKFDRVVAAIKVAAIPSQVLVSEAVGAIAVSFAGRRTLEVVNLPPASGRANIDLTMTPDVMVLSPDGYLVAAADISHRTVSVISLQNRRLLFSLGGFGDPGNLTFSQDGSQLYITDRKSLELIVVDIVQQSVYERLALAGEGYPKPGIGQEHKNESGVSALTRTPDGRHGFISVAGQDSVVVVDLGSVRTVKRIRVGHKPLRPYGTSDGRLMLVPSAGDQSVSIIDTSTLEVVATLPGAGDVAAVNTGWFDSFAFVMSPGQKRIVVLDLMKFRKAGEIELPGVPGPGAVNSTGLKLYATLEDTHQVAVINTHTHKLISLIGGVGHEPWATTMAHTNNYCH